MKPASVSVFIGDKKIGELKDQQRQLKRTLACLTMLYPDFEVTGKIDGSSIITNIQVPGGMRLGLAFELRPDAPVTNAELLSQLTDAAERLVARYKGAIQPYAPGCPPVDLNWPEEKPITEPPPDGKLVVVTQGGHYARARLDQCVWFETDEFFGRRLLRGFIPTHWRELSAYEKATLPKNVGPIEPEVSLCVTKV